MSRTCRPHKTVCARAGGFSEGIGVCEAALLHLEDFQCALYRDGGVKFKSQKLFPAAAAAPPTTAEVRAAAAVAERDPVFSASNLGAGSGFFVAATPVPQGEVEGGCCHPGYDLGSPPVSFWGFVRFCILTYLIEVQRRA